MSRLPLSPGQKIAFIPVQQLAGPAERTDAFCPGWRHQPGQKGGLLSRLVAPTGTKGPRSLLSRLETPTGTKGLPFIPVGGSNRDMHLLSRLEPPTGTKEVHSSSHHMGTCTCKLVATDTTTDWAICPGSKGLFVPVLEPGFGRRDKSPWRLLSRVVEPGQKVPHAKKSLRPAGFEP